ncbi:hypothetical protein [Paraburkholderia bannensis]|uniref:hypothetical protein n=1 Tax=Paraburkholderia bannensis TaxID=765414 RepID=UPI002AB69A6A|nr:hypothetical protein [Paraburkholderia bannensis]
MQLRTVYLKVKEMEPSIPFWQCVLGYEPHKRSAKWSEFMVGASRLGLLLNDFGDDFKGSSSVPVFELEEIALHDMKALTLNELPEASVNTNF